MGVPRHGCHPVAAVAAVQAPGVAAGVAVRVAVRTCRLWHGLGGRRRQREAQAQQLVLAA